MENFKTKPKTVWWDEWQCFIFYTFPLIEDSWIFISSLALTLLSHITKLLENSTVHY